VVTVIYAPPGANNGHGGSKVVYGKSISTGSTTTIAHTFKDSTSMTSGFEFGDKDGSIDASGTVEFQYSDEDANSLQMLQTTSQTIERDGPGQDGINHDEDEIWLWLNPKINLTLTGISGVWQLSHEEAPIVKPVLVGWLNFHDSIPQGDQIWMEAYGINTNDFPAILSHDPLALSENALNDTNRFVPLKPAFDYNPPLQSNDPPIELQSYSVTSKSTTENTQNTESDSTVSYTMSASVPFGKLFKETLKDSDSWTWGTKRTSSSSSSVAVSGGITIGGPAYGYSGFTSVYVFYDSFYQTYAFALKAF
jgi:hypothetical protein